MILRRILAAAALLCAIVTTAHAQTGTPKTAAQLNAEINSLFADQNSQAITPFDLRQVTLDQVASGILGAITLSGDVSGSGINTILTSIGATAVHSSMLNADVFSTARSWSALQTFSGGITGLPAPVNPSDAATKQYVDGVAVGLIILVPSAVATAAILPNTPTYNNGTAGVGATLTAGSNSTLTVDGTAAPLNTVVLVKSQVSAFQNGIYTVTAAGSGAAPWVLTRATYFNTAAQMKVGSYTFVTGGVANLNSSWTLAATVTTVGTDPLNWTQFSSTGGVSNVAGFTGAVSAAQLTSACNVFTSSLSGCIPSASGTTAVSQMLSSGSWAVPAAYVASSRAAAAALNLTGVSTVQTLGYATPGDGGRATFKNIGSAAFIDSFITTFTITGGSGYTNGNYFGVTLVNTTKPFAIGTATVSGGAVTTVSVAGTPGGLCHIGDIYTTGSIPGGAGFQITVTGCSTPLGSFTDSASNNFQITYDGSSPNVLQFGAVGNWAGADGSATDNFNTMQAALWFTSFMDQLNSGNGGYWGGRLWVPQGTFLACGTGSKSLIVPNGVTLEGASNQGSVIKMCDTFSSTTNFVELCDPNWHFACFSSVLDHLQLFATRTPTATNGFAMVHSNATQDFGGVSYVYIYGGLRQCLILEKGYGGAGTMEAHNISCTTASASPQIVLGNTSGSGLDLGTTIINLHDLSLGGPSGGSVFQTGNGILIEGGFVDASGVHCEEMPNCVEVNNPGAITAGMVRLNNINAGSSSPAPTCTGTVLLDATNTPGNTLLSMIPAGSCTNTILNGQSGGTNFTGNVVKPITCVSGACS